jgi:hypothetical protein
MARACSGLVWKVTGDFPFGTTRPGRAPCLRQKQTPVQQDLPSLGRIGEQGGHLAILDLAQRSTVVLVHAHRARALLGATRLIQDRTPFRVGKALDDELLQAVAGGLHVPRHAIEQALQAIGGTILDDLG